jgi:hypothetical protein
MVQIGFIEDFSVENINKAITDFELSKSNAATITSGSGSTSNTFVLSYNTDLTIKAAESEKKMDRPEDGHEDEITKSYIDLQNNNSNDSVTNMELSTDQKVTMVHKFMSWLGFGDDEVEKVTTTVETEVQETEETAEEIVEKNGGSEEVDINELTSALSTMLDDKLTKVREDIEASLETKINEKVDAVTKSVSEVAEKVETVSASVTEVSEKVETIDETTAVKKSVDKTDGVETIEKTRTESFWGNIFVPREICEVLGYDS